MIREGIDPRELAVNARRERERIEPVLLAHERHHLRGVGLRAGLDALQRGLRRVVVPAQAGADAFFALEFE